MKTHDVKIGFDAVFDNASMGIIVADELGDIVLVNPFLLRQFDYLASELEGRHISRLIPSRFHQKHQQHLAGYSQHPKSRPMGLGMDLFAVRKDGSEFPVEVSLGRYEEGQNGYTIAFVTDISKRKSAEHALRCLNEELEAKVVERTSSLTNTVKNLAKLVAETESKDLELKRINSFLSSIWQHSEAIIFVTDQEGIIKIFNTTAERQLGYQASEVVNKATPLIFYEPMEIARMAAEVGIRLKPGNKPGFEILSDRAVKGLTHESELLLVSKDLSTIPVSLTFTAMKDASLHVNGYLGIAINISERKKAEKGLLMALKKERELSELKSGFVSMASHEFRTPLSTILSSAYLISKYENTEAHPKREKHVQRIVSSVNMLTNILNDFLSVGKIEEGKIQVRYSSFDIAQNIKDVISELSGVLKNGQRILYSHRGDPIVVLDAGLLKHILMNLISNAIKFSDEGAVIRIDTDRGADSLLLAVSDEGIGISQQDQKHLFERFFRGANADNIQGTGLGLHIIAKYAELMNGSVKCKSVIGKGTSFEIFFLLERPN